MHPIRNAVKNISFLWLGSLVGSGSTFLLYVLLARSLSTEEFGVLSAVLSITNFSFIFIGFGVGQFWLKAFGKYGVNAKAWLPASRTFIFTSFSLTAMAYFLWSLVGPHDSKTKYVLLIFSIAMLSRGLVELVSSKLQLEERFSALAGWQLAPNTLRLLAVLICIYWLGEKINVYAIAWAYSLVTVPIVIVSVIVLERFFRGGFHLKGKREGSEIPTRAPGAVEVARESWPFGAATLFSFIYIQSDLIMLKYISGNSETAFYNAAFVITTAVLIIPSVLYGKYFLPMYHRWASHEKERLYKSYKLGNRVMGVLGFLVMCILFIGADYYMPLIFGEGYSASVEMMKILSLTIPVFFVCYSAGAILVTNNHMRYKIMLMGAVAILNIALNAALIPMYSGVGAAIATLLSNACLLVFYIYAARKRVFSGIGENA